jgi:hypothetical protein
MKKVVRLTESDLVRLVKRVISEQTQPKNFRIGPTTYQIQKSTPIDKIWNKLEYVKLLPNGMIEKKLNVGYVTYKLPKTIYQSQNINSPKVGVADMNLVIVPESPKPQNQPERPKPQNQPENNQNLIQSLKDGITNIFKNKKVELKNNILSVGDAKIELSGNRVMSVFIPKSKTIDRQTLPEVGKTLKIDLENIELNRALSLIKKTIDDLTKEQNSSFKTTVKKTKPTMTRDVPYNGTPVKLS